MALKAEIWQNQYFSAEKMRDVGKNWTPNYGDLLVRV